MIETNIIQTTINEGIAGKPTIFFLKGLPASGKSTWARQHSDATTVRLNNDVFRSMMVGEYSDKKEGVTVAGIRAAGCDALRRGMNIIVDNTNFSSKHLNFWKQVADQHDYALVELFFDVPLDVCIERDAHRPDGEKVGHERITEMHHMHIGFEPLSTVIDYRKQDETLKQALIVDIDGTLAFMNGRGAFDDNGIETDEPNAPIVELINHLGSRHHHIIVVSGRQATAVCKTVTEVWLKKYLCCKFDLFMRVEGDVRKDSIVKREIFEQYIDGKYYVEWVFDDRDQTVEMWRKELHLPCLQVNYGNF